jgi:sec-independent protein translocase protein TatC
LGGEAFSINLINTGLAEQFLIHMKVALMVGILVASPYILFLLFRFIAPALYENERRYSVRITVAAYAMFLLGIVVNYFIIFPLTVRFLGTYQVSETVSNMLTISSYIDTLMMMSLIFGIIFEIPVVSWLLAIFGLLKASWMSQYRRHAVIAILILAAAITPTGDALTLVIVALPIWLLYEVSILIVKISNGSTNEHK